MATTFVELADTLVGEFDIAEFCHSLTERCVELLPVSEAGLMLAHGERLEVMASSSERGQVLEVLQHQRRTGPAWDAYRTGRPVFIENLDDVGGDGHDFAEAAVSLGFRSVHALPLRLRDEVIGALNLLVADPGGMERDEVAIAQALADVATIGILQMRAVREAEATSENLQTALRSRVIIEQAKGIVSENLRVGMDEAFSLVRSHARNSNRRLTEVAQAIVNGYLSPQDLGRGFAAPASAEQAS